jgi:tetratricopeptide (TPR) repeat protein
MRKFLLLIPAMFVWSCQSTGSDATEAQEIPVEATATQRNTALDSLNEIIRYAPNDLDALEARAEVYLRQQNLKYAAADVAAVLQLDSARTKALELWGDISFSTNQTRQSRDAWQKCMAEDPENVPCRLKMAELYHVVTEFEKSAELVDEVIELDPTNPEAHFLKGLLMRDALGDTTRALEWFQKAIDLDPEYIEALDMCGVLYSALGNPLALAYFNRLVELQPQNRIAMYNRGMFHLGMEDWNRALEDFTTCTQLDPDDLESWFNLGYIHLQLQMYPEARGYFNTALRIQPVNHRALYARGYCYELLGDINNAEADYREALSYNPTHEGSKQGMQRMQRARAQAGQ